MYKLMVVDDEKIVVDSVNFIIKNRFSNVKVIASARNSTDAIENFVRYKPDIVLMDICMPGMNGLDAIAEMKQITPTARFVVISAYEQFEFAKQAVELDVKEYLLKPVNAKRLTETVANIAAELDAERTKVKKNLETKEKYDQALNILEHWLIYSIMLNKDPSAELKKYCDLVGIKETDGYVMIFGYNYQDQLAERGDQSKNTGDEQFIVVLNDILKVRNHCLVGPAMQDRIITYVFSKRYEESEGRLKSIGFAEEILREIKKVSNLDFAVGIGGIKDRSLIIESYDEARKALRQASAGAIHYFDIRTKFEDKISTLTDDWHLLNSLESGDDEAVGEIVDSIFDSYDFKELVGGNGLNIRNKLIELMVVAHRLAQELNVGEDEQLDFNTYLNEMLEISDLKNFRAWYKTRLVNLAIKIQKVREANISRIVHDTKQYIEKNYNCDISLEETAKEIGISPHYLSKLFKKETKVNFIDYLTRLRLAKAKDLMKEGGRSIKEICYMVGYTDPNYFSRIFKKHTDHSPSEFIKGV